MPLAIALFAYVQHCSSQEEAFDVLITVPEQCQQQDGNVVVNFPLAIPPEIDFLIGPKGTVRPIAAIVNEDASGAGGLPALRAYKPGEYDISAGIVNGSVANRVVIKRASLCDVKYSIQLVYELADRHGSALPKIRAYIGPGADQRTTLTPSARALAIEVFDRKYGASLKYFVSDAFRWLEATKGARAMSKMSSAFSMYKYSDKKEDCWNCSKSIHAKSLKLARLLNSVDTVYVLRESEKSPLAKWPGTFTFNPNRSLTLEFGGAGELALHEDEWGWQVPSVDQLLEVEVFIK